ncbi:30S ribosomal protein S6 [Paracrocinitomix mangrovi]|uniref:30S ribosomal protein S6 n=1 Tax=Paracrocinitomix mangrovi TaxID=2862509 RepID=UPI001C8D8BCD|nr:30S ribosomal protein S6 [Paracrocinitomix mangrovi]UKN02111.1 30S ribosomal protein S6 [Paracrocinitomix mangrovi]
MNRYETVFILTPVLSEEQAKEAVKVYEDYITKNGGTIKHKEFWGLKKLAYQIQKKSTGFYSLVEFENDGTLIKKLEIEFKRDERIMRFLSIRMDKHHVAFAEKTRKAGTNTAKTEEKAEA